MIDNLMMNIGAFFLIVGGTLLLGIVCVLLVWILGCLWISASDTWRAICKAESLIFEYRKNRNEYLRWKAHVKDGEE